MLYNVCYLIITFEEVFNPANPNNVMLGNVLFVKCETL